MNHKNIFLRLCLLFYQWAFCSAVTASMKMSQTRLKNLQSSEKIIANKYFYKTKSKYRS